MCKDCSNSDLSLLEPVFAEFEGDKHALVTILQKAQEIYGYLPTDVIYRIAEKQGVSPAKVLGVATFYSQFRLKPVGKNLILLCKDSRLKFVQPVLFHQSAALVFRRKQAVRPPDSRRILGFVI